MPFLELVVLKQLPAMDEENTMRALRVRNIKSKLEKHVFISSGFRFGLRSSLMRKPDQSPPPFPLGAAAIDQRSPQLKDHRGGGFTL